MQGTEQPWVDWLGLEHVDGPACEAQALSHMLMALAHALRVDQMEGVENCIKTGKLQY